MENNDSVIPAQPLLTKYPDARCAGRALFHELLFPYVALLAGPLAAGVCAAYNAHALRRYGLAAGCLALAVVGWLLVAPFKLALLAAGITHPTALIVCARLFALIPGVWMLLRLKPHIQGHRFLYGRVLALDRSVIVIFVATFFLSGRAVLFLLGVRQ